MSWLAEHMHKCMYHLSMPAPIGRALRRSNRYQLLLAHIAMLATSILAMLLAFHKGFAYSYRLSNMVSITCLYAAIVVAPFILAVLGLCSSSPTALLKYGCRFA